MKKIATLSILILFQLNLLADNEPIGSLSKSMGNASVAYVQNTNFTNNQAILGLLTSSNISLYYNANFFIPQINTKSLYFNHKLSTGGIGLQINNDGYSKYSKTQVGISYGIQLFEKLAAGIQIDYFFLKQTSYYGNFHSVSTQIAILARPIENLAVGMQIFNPWRAHFFKNSNIYIPTIMRVGTSYRFNPNFIFSAEIYKNLDYPTFYNVGGEYQFTSSLYLRFGASFSNKFWMPTFGIAYEYKKINFEIAFSNRQILGFEAGMTLSYRLEL